MLDILLLAQQAVPAANPADLRVWAYVGFIGLVIFFLALDLGVFHRNAREVSIAEAAGWSVVWVTLGLLFAVFVYYGYEKQWLGLGVDTPRYATSEEVAAGSDAITRGIVPGAEAAEQYLTGYIVEKSLAMDNIFVIAMLFGFFAIPLKYQHRVLFWGIIGALVMRGVMIFIGAELVMRYTWVLIFFGVFLLLTAVKMALIRSSGSPADNIVVRLCKKILPLRDFYDGQRFFTRRTEAPTYAIDAVSGVPVQEPARPGTLGVLAMTPMFLALVMVEVTDLVFAVDSIPAIFAITPDPFIVFTSNIFAILGLRSLYFCLAALIQRFRFLKPALILILAFVGVKLLLMSVPPYLDRIIGGGPYTSIKVDTTVSLVAVLATLGLAVVLSVIFPGKAGTKSGH